MARTIVRVNIDQRRIVIFVGNENGQSKDSPNVRPANENRADGLRAEVRLRTFAGIARFDLQPMHRLRFVVENAANAYVTCELIHVEAALWTDEVVADLGVDTVIVVLGMDAANERVHRQTLTDVLDRVGRALEFRRRIVDIVDHDVHAENARLIVTIASDDLELIGCCHFSIERSFDDQGEIAAYEIVSQREWQRARRNEGVA